MLFPSVVFLAWFAPLFLCVYFFLPWKNLSFFLFSLVFFFWGETKYIGVLLAYIAVSYLFGLLIGTRNTPALRRKWALAIGVTADLGILAYYKYWIFLLQTVLPDFFGISVGEFHHPHLPLGISYFTFHGISYLVDVYRGTATRAKSPLHVGLYIAMFPHMVAGPIVRYHTIAKALLHRSFTVRRIAFSLRLFAIGMAQKMLIANSVDAATPGERSPGPRHDSPFCLHPGRAPPYSGLHPSQPDILTDRSRRRAPEPGPTRSRHGPVQDPGSSLDVPRRDRRPLPHDPASPLSVMLTTTRTPTLAGLRPAVVQSYSAPSRSAPPSRAGMRPSAPPRLRAALFHGAPELALSHSRSRTIFTKSSN